MVSARLGRSNLGCLMTLLLGTAALYFAFPIGEAYLNDFRFRDRMAQEATFADRRTDEEIRRRLASFADSLGLPPQAQRVQVVRTPQRIRISARYARTFAFPFVSRELVFTPSAEHAF